MKIAQIFPGVIPPQGYGGIERVVFWLSKELIALGHEVVVVANIKSQDVLENYGIKFIEFPDELHQLNNILSNVDIFHFHFSIHDSYIPNKPYLITEHGNHRQKKKIKQNTIFLSKSHAENHGSSYFVSNGVPLENYSVVNHKEDDFLFMAKLAWRKKNAITAINLSYDLNIPLNICGGDPWKERKIRGAWYRKAKSGRYDNLLIGHGNVEGVIKSNLLSQSGLLFYLVNWQEPFALAPHESMACGTPVLASPNGALKEYIIHDQNGYIVNDYDEAKKALLRHFSKSIAEKNEMYAFCRESAYDIKSCAIDYLAFYKKILQEEFLYTEAELKRLRYKPSKSISIKKPFFSK